MPGLESGSGFVVGSDVVSGFGGTGCVLAIGLKALECFPQSLTVEYLWLWQASTVCSGTPQINLYVGNTA